MNWVVTIYTAILFFVLTPNIVLRLPPKGKPVLVAAVHAVIFALVYHFTHKMVWKASMSMNSIRDGFSEGVNGKDKKPDNNKPDNNKPDNNKPDNKKPDNKKP